MSLPGAHVMHVAWGWQGCRPSWPEGHCGFECVDSLRALRQVPGAGRRQDDQGQEPARPNSLARHGLFFQNCTAMRRGG